MDILVQLLQILPGTVLAQTEDLAGGGDVGAAGGGGIGPNEHILIVGVQQIIPGLRQSHALGRQFGLEALFVDDDAQHAHVPSLPEMIGIIEPLVQAIVVGGVILQESTGLGQRTIQIHRTAHQEVGLGIVHFRLHTGHGVSAAQGNILDLDAGVLFELLGNGNGVVLIECGVNDQLAAALCSAGFFCALSAGGQRQCHRKSQSYGEQPFHNLKLPFIIV